MYIKQQQYMHREASPVYNMIYTSHTNSALDRQTEGWDSATYLRFFFLDEVIAKP
jgi:hypothetical protein